MSFDSFRLLPEIRRAIGELGFTEPTPIQLEAIPTGLLGRDLLACAMTGSGKTAGFGIPLLQRLAPRPKNQGPRALVITPTRELASQVAEDLNDLGRHLRFRIATVFGGVGMKPQVDALRRGLDVLVATPGRLLDHMGQGTCRLEHVEILVLDEADRMLDMGFLPDVKRILSRVPKHRQTLLFSATMPPPIARLAHDFLHDPVKINVERRSAPATGVRQSVLRVDQDRKGHALLDLIADPKAESILTFTRTKHRADKVAKFLVSFGVTAARIHGNRSQSQREQALEDFRDGKIRVLVATDIAARGIDIAELSHVVNYDVPHVPDDYIHRVGRTARAGLTGEALTFVAPDEESDFRAIEKAVGQRMIAHQSSGRVPQAPPRHSAPQHHEQRHEAPRHREPRHHHAPQHAAQRPAAPTRSHRSSGTHRPLESSPTGRPHAPRHRPGKKPRPGFSSRSRSR